GYHGRSAPVFDRSPRRRNTHAAGRGLFLRMRILLVNPRHPSIGSRIPDDHLPPLGLLSIGGPLIDAGHTVKLLDADRENLPVAEAARRVLAWSPDAV